MPLVNEIAPVEVLISNDGKYIATFDNWYHRGSGENVVVIYNALDGKPVKKFVLSDFLTKNDVASLPRSVSSINWSGSAVYSEPHRIDEDKRQLILKIVKSIDIKQLFDVRIDLTNGAVLDEIIDRVTPRKVSFQ